ncbi:MAG: N-acetylmuramic acid 6-phosphate etherase [Alphaproteobacteria bacterium ADurb.Bin438]|nr:MAG: N-acetylmuramic acid 6-phosphate etherase [Alphaproteobacteria bacterium ADurb.Bin438]
MIITEENNLATVGIDAMSSIDIVKTINNEDKMVALAVESEALHIAEAIDLVSEAFLNGGNLIYFGAGTSGRLGVLDASECPPTFNSSAQMVRAYIAGGNTAMFKAVEGAEDSYDEGVEDVLKAKIRSKDVVVGISASGNPAYLIGVMEKASSIGAKVVGLTCNREAKIRSFCDVFIAVEVGAEVIAGSSRMKAGTAQKMVLNMISTGSMIKIGKVYQNLMVDVRCTNVKLVKRAMRIIMKIANTTEEQALKFLEFSGYDIKIALVMLMKNVNKDMAIAMLEEHNYVLRKVIG